MSDDAAHWKANHDRAVARCALLSQRPDLPVDRLPAYYELAKLQRDNASLINVIDMLHIAISTNQPRDMIVRIDQEAQRLIGLLK